MTFRGAATVLVVSLRQGRWGLHPHPPLTNLRFFLFLNYACMNYILVFPVWTDLYFYFCAMLLVLAFR